MTLYKTQSEYHFPLLVKDPRICIKIETRTKNPTFSMKHFLTNSEYCISIIEKKISEMVLFIPVYHLYVGIYTTAYSKS